MVCRGMRLRVPHFILKVLKKNECRTTLLVSVSSYQVFFSEEEDCNCSVCFLSASVVDVLILINRFDAVPSTSRGHQLQTGFYCSCSLFESDLMYSVNKMMQNCVNVHLIPQCRTA